MTAIPDAWALSPRQRALVEALAFQQGATIEELARLVFGRSGAESENMVRAQIAMLQSRLRRRGLFIGADLSRRWRLCAGARANRATIKRLSALREARATTGSGA